MALPDINQAYVRSFCRSVVADSEPIYVTHEPLNGRPMCDCFPIVEEMVSIVGGEMVVGWALGEWREVWIEAEFHAVWRQPSGELIDVAPRDGAWRRIAFLPDPQRPYEGKLVDNVRQARRFDTRINRYFDLARQRFAILAAQDGAGEISKTREAEIKAALAQVEFPAAALYLELVNDYGHP